MFFLFFTVSHICNLTLFKGAERFLQPNSTPIVESRSGLKRFSKNCNKIQDFPTP